MSGSQCFGHRDEGEDGSDVIEELRITENVGGDVVVDLLDM
jgi:hypothetical protein